MVGRLGLGLLSIDPDLIPEYLAGLDAGGHDRSTARLCGELEFFCTDDPDRTWAELGEHFLYRWRSYNRYMFEGTRREGDGTEHFDTANLRDRFLMGTAEAIVSAVRSRVADLPVPVTELYVWSDYPGIPDDLVDRHLELTFREVAPLLRAL